MFTTSAESADVEEAYRLGANGYLVKPANINDLVKIFQSVRAFWLEHNLLPLISGGKVPPLRARPEAVSPRSPISAAP